MLSYNKVIQYLFLAVSHLTHLINLQCQLRVAHLAAVSYFVTPKSCFISRNIILLFMILTTVCRTISKLTVNINNKTSKLSEI